MRGRAEEKGQARQLVLFKVSFALAPKCENTFLRDLLLSLS